MTILAACREHGAFSPRVLHLPEGETLWQMSQRLTSLPPDFAARGVIRINGHAVARGAWHMITPKPAANGVPVEVTFLAPPMGGGGDGGGKNVLALVASIALTVATGFIAGGGLGGIFAKDAVLFGVKGLAATALASGVALAGSLLLSALIPPPTLGNASSRRIDNPGGASAEGNVLEPNGPVPFVVGRRKIFPPLLCEPLTYFEGPDEIVEAVYGLSGPHELDDIRVGAAAIDGMADVEVEVREGWPGDLPLTLVTRQSRTEGLQIEVRGHAISQDNGLHIEVLTGDVAASLPQAQVVATRTEPDEQWLHILFPQGLHRNGSDTDKLRVPFRLRLREAGAPTWIDLPELHFQAANLRQMRATIRLVWTAAPTVAPGAATMEGWVEARIHSPGQAALPVTAAWDADAYFDDGAGDDYVVNGNIGTTAVNHVIMDRYTASIYLDVATFPKGRYEVEIRRGAPILSSGYSAAAYTVDGSVWDLFGYRDTTTPRIPQTRDGIADTVYLLRSVSVWNEHPAPTDNCAMIAVRARNRQLDAISTVAGRYVRDWGGTGWTDWVVTSNPAPHLREVFTGSINADPIPEDLIDDATLVDWRTRCAEQGYECNAIFEGQTVADVAQVIASCGYAKPYMSEIWGVAQDYDRSAESPVQVFSPHNSSGFSWRRAFPRVPDGFRVTFRDVDRDYEPRQISVFRPGASDDSGLVEQVTYEGLVTEAEAAARAEYDQAQPVYRGTFYSLEAGTDALVCRRGSLVGVQHDMLTRHAGSGRVVDFTLDGAGLVTGIVLDAEVPVTSEPFMDEVADLSAVEDLSLLGVSSGVALRRTTGTVTVHAPTNASGMTSSLTFSPGLTAAGIGTGLMVTVGHLGREYRRLIVFAIEPRPNYQASLTLVDEAPELWPPAMVDPEMMFDGDPMEFDGDPMELTSA